ncbi:MAG: iron export ABC transporter permease subunit FetB [Caulobacteraceae bacterium]|nr:iron export ABC transporter permease subunit FetB [Caulobacteraceae bacterium]
MNTVISLTPRDLLVASSLIVLDAILSLVLQLNLHRQIVIASLRMVLQLLLIGYVLKLIFALNNPAVTLLLILIMVLIAARETAARPERRFKGWTTLGIGAASVASATLITALFALTTALRPHPWYAPRYAVPLAGILLGNILNATSLSLDSLLGSIARERPAVEARLTLGATYWEAATPFVRGAIRRGLVPIINQMSASGVVTLPGIMTGQILAGLDPMEAVKYQILLMFLLSGGSGLAAAGAAYLAAWGLTDDRQRLRLDRLAQARAG